MASLYLASKVEEVQKRARDVINVFNHIEQIETKKKVEPLSLGSEVCLFFHSIFSLSLLFLETHCLVG